MLLNVETGQHRIVRTPSYSALPDGEVGLMIDANGVLSLVAHCASAATLFGIDRGATVTLRNDTDSAAPDTSPVTEIPVVLGKKPVTKDEQQ